MGNIGWESVNPGEAPDLVVGCAGQPMVEGSRWQGTGSGRSSGEQVESVVQLWERGPRGNQGWLVDDTGRHAAGVDKATQGRL
jgi:hypothetical protein